MRRRIGGKEREGRGMRRKIGEKWGEGGGRKGEGVG